MKYKRILLKLTGEVFESPKYDLDAKSGVFITKEIASVHSLGVDIGIVVGAGNIIRGAGLAENKFIKIDRVSADELGMLATLINANFLKTTLGKMGVGSKVFSAKDAGVFANKFILDDVQDCFQEKKIGIFACGTGISHLTTDTAAVIRASEICADAILKGTNVDGVFSEDPKENTRAKFLKEVSYEEVLRNRLGFMDFVALEMASDLFKKPIYVFNIFQNGNLKKVVNKKNVGSKVS